MPSLFVNQQLPATSEQAIREFNEKYLAVFTAAPAPTWCDRFTSSVTSPRATYPVSAFSAKFRETREKSSRFRSMTEKSFDLRVVEYDEGFEAPMLELSTNVFAYKQWSRAPEELRKAEARHTSRNLAALLDGGTTGISPWDDLPFFSATHLANPFNPDNGVFSNFQSTPKDPAVIANLQAEMTFMRGVKDVNGDKLGVEPMELWLPTEKFQFVSDLLSQNMINGGDSNPLVGRLKCVHIPENIDSNDWYLVDPSLIGAGYDPLLATTYVPTDTLGLRFWDESSDFYKDTGKIKVSQHIWKGFSLLFPHAIRRVAGI
jgi:hypothetical protein